MSDVGEGKKEKSATGGFAGRGQAAERLAQYNGKTSAERISHRKVTPPDGSDVTQFIE